MKCNTFLFPIREINGQIFIKRGDREKAIHPKKL